jgi:hypothetical protein
MSNLDFQVFDKSGNSLFGPVPNNTLWSGFGGNCQTHNDGDPVVLYDQLADRWLLTQFTASVAPYYNCVALSQTSDPAGAYYRWAFPVGNGNNFGDYPKYGMWPDPNAYFISTREFQGGSTFVGVGAYALNRAQMLVGNPNPQMISFLAPPNPAYVVGDGLLPADLDGTTLPPPNRDEYYMGSEDNNGPYGAPSDALTLWKFHVDFPTPGNSSFTLVNTIPSAPFNSILGLCGGTRACIPQLGTANKIDHLGYRQRPLFRLAYRNMGTYESLLTNQSVSAGTGPSGEVSGIRWWEVRSPNSSPSIFQQGTYAPGLTDGIHRWMGSIAMDHFGNIAMGYSASNSTMYPSVFYTGRMAADPPGQMTLGEAAIVNGTGSQTAGGNRWGDYTNTTVDPVDDCTFWHVNEYVPSTSAAGWRLRIGAFRLPGCGPATPTPVNTPTSTDTPTPIPTDTPVPTDTSVPTDTPVPTDTSTAVPPTATATACTIQFSDVPVGSTFYQWIHCLVCLGIVNGYSDGTFRPNNNVTRGQLSKIVSNSAGFSDNQTTQMFEDVPVGSTFFQYIGRLATRGFISGYPCGGPGEPCGPSHLPYFRPNANATRGQISKIVSNAAGFTDTPHGQQFQDVSPNSAFYAYIYRLSTRGIINGYQCGQKPNEPCGPGNLPYFRPSNLATRGQMSKIDAAAFFPDCNIPHTSTR